MEEDVEEYRDITVTLVNFSRSFILLTIVQFDHKFVYLWCNMIIYFVNRGAIFPYKDQFTSKNVIVPFDAKISYISDISLKI
jgi:hypothetical protein